jgi:N-acetylglucosaminyl-diphospho-decaprenol L-rhamnosyltransferase
MGVDVVIVNWNGGPELVHAVESAKRFGGNPIVVDNASTVGAIDDAAAIEGVTVVRNEKNLGFAGGCNRGVSAGTAEYVFLLNPDAVIASGTAADLPAAFAESGATLLAPQLEHSSGRPLLAVRRFPGTTDLLDDLLRVKALGRRLRPTTGPRSVTEPTRSSRGWIVGAAVIVRRSDWLRLGGMDEGYFLWYEDQDLGLRATESAEGVASTPRVLVRHEGASTWVRLPRRRRQWLRIKGAFRYARQHLGLLPAAAVVACAPLAMLIGVAHDATIALAGGD